MIDFEAILDKQYELKRKLKAADKMRERATDISVHLSDMPRGAGGNSQEKIRIEMIAAHEAVIETEKELKELIKPLRLKLRTVKKWQYKDAIRKRYIDGKTIQETADEIGYEIRQTKRFISEGRKLINRL